MTSKDAKIEKRERNKYSLIAEEPGAVNVEIYNKKTKTAQTFPVRVFSCKPKAFLNHGGYLTKNAKRALKYSTGLRTKVYEPISLTLNGPLLCDVIVIHKNKVFRFKNEKRKFSENIRSMFQILEKDDIVIFRNIRLKAGGVKEFLLDDLVFEVN